MTVPKKLSVVGGVTIGAPSSCATWPSGDSTFLLNLDQYTQADVQKALSINSPGTFIDMLAGTGITNVSFYALRVKNASSFTIRFTTADGADQLRRCSDLDVYSSPATGQQITALAVRGVGDLELMIAGT